MNPSCNKKMVSVFVSIKNTLSVQYKIMYTYWDTIQVSVYPCVCTTLYVPLTAGMVYLR